ncbi:ATP-binding cassette domain-containing protein [Patescibacteria group bacterium]|nr:ATP-binding cassette domain-containing protein [Patescibacteria group bacterium]MBU1911179.1 ATP-binding cassette domain-containing protein [Patescibacteria group bacterium]
MVEWFASHASHVRRGKRLSKYDTNIYIIKPATVAHERRGLRNPLGTIRPFNHLSYEQQYVNIPTMITLSSVSKQFKNRVVLDCISLSIKPGEFVTITGPSGAGKSTLIHLIAGMERATSGKVEFDGINLGIVPPIALRLFRQRIGIVFQDYKLLSGRTVAENIAFPLEVCGASKQSIYSNVKGAIHKMKLQKVANALPRELSGGEMARTAIARAMVHGPMILFCDEPTGNLDAVQSIEILRFLQKIHKEGTTVVLATHDPALMEIIKGRIIQLQDGMVLSDTNAREVKEETIDKNEKSEIKTVSAKKPTSANSNSGKRKVKITAIHTS